MSLDVTRVYQTHSSSAFVKVIGNERETINKIMVSNTRFELVKIVELLTKDRDIESTISIIDEGGLWSYNVTQLLFEGFTLAIGLYKKKYIKDDHRLILLFIGCFMSVLCDEDTSQLDQKNSTTLVDKILTTLLRIREDIAIRKRVIRLLRFKALRANKIEGRRDFLFSQIYLTVSTIKRDTNMRESVRRLERKGRFPNRDYDT